MAGEISGLVEVLGNIANFEQEVLFHVEDAVLGAAQDAKDFADPLTPVKSGYLKSRNQVRGPVTTLGNISAEYYNDAPYALYVDAGTVHMAAQPFMTPALVYGQQQLVKRIREL